MSSQTQRVCDYRTGETLVGGPSERLIEESSATPEGAVLAWYEEPEAGATDEGAGLGVWHCCDESMRSHYQGRGVDVRTVYVS